MPAETSELRQKIKVVLFPEIGRVKILLSLTCLRSRTCSGIYIFNLKTKTTQKRATKIIREKAKETKKDKRVYVENLTEYDKYRLQISSVYF